MIDISWIIKRNNSEAELKEEFDCGDKDLNDYFNEDAFTYHNEMLSKTYSVYKSNELIAKFSLSNDSIRLDEDKRNNKFSPNCRLTITPAVKIGRLGINREHQKKGIGSKLLSLIKYYICINNKTGCRFITIDAYNRENVLNFYTKNKFIYLNDKQKDRIGKKDISAISLFYDLIETYNGLINKENAYNLHNEFINKIFKY